MRVFIAGATGAVGASLVPMLLARGHTVVGLARSQDNAARLRGWGAIAKHADIMDPNALSKVMVDSDVVVRIATHIPKGDWTPDEIAQNDRLRRDGTRALLDAATNVGAEYYVQESVAWSDRRDPTTASAVEAEEFAARAAVPSATLRLGWLYGPASAHTRGFAKLLRAGQFALPAADSAEKSFLHLDDAGSAFLHAIEARPTGNFDVADREPIAIGTYFDVFADALGVARPPRAPYDPGFFGMANRVDAAPFEKVSGWMPRHPTVRDGLRQTVQALPN